ncbi:hypothetical protein ASG31_16670 [Chryseobacterium sp. Leaf404]|nr:hypothetical protein ASG31_16670 [Chryseobacterium sp. Leaf404]
MLLISSFTYAQYSPGGCIPTPPPLDRLILNPIGDQGFPVDKATNLSNFLVSMNRTIDNGQTSGDLTQYEKDYINNANYIWAKGVIASTNANVNDVVNQVNRKLAQSRSIEDKAFCVLFLYEIQMLQSKGMVDKSSTIAKRPCTPKEKLELLATGAALGSLAEPGLGTALGALVGAAIGAFGGC